MTASAENLAPAERLRTAGLRVTTPRIAVLDVVMAAAHVTAEEVSGRVRERLGAVSTQTVYDALRACTDAGLMRRIDPPGSAARYETRTGDNHHHLVCRQCGRIEDVECALGTAPCLQAAEDHGFAIDEAEIVYWGLCPECQASEALA